MSQQQKPVKAKFEQRRSTLTQHRDNYLGQAYEAEVQLEALKVQPNVPDEERDELVQQLTQKMENAQASAERMHQLLDELTRAPAKK